MKILAIETSCDETAISVVKFNKSGKPEVLSHIVSSQTKIHEPFGGVVPNLAARAHQANLTPLLREALKESNLLNLKSQAPNTKQIPNYKLQTTDYELRTVLAREPELLKQFEDFVPTIQPPEIDAIAVTQGPGLEPALWVGINFAKALALVWQKPLIPVNHMEGHIASVFVGGNVQSSNSQSLNKNSLKFGMFEGLNFPAVALLISGGHTELILIEGVGEYQLLGGTRDDAVGEAFDKVARLLGLPYPGGPQISRLAEEFEKARSQKRGARSLIFPRPMIDSNNYDFSFSGLKTAVRYKIDTLRQSSGRLDLPEQIKSEITYEFQEAVIEVLVKKTMRAVKAYGAKTLIVGGGVIANKKLRAAFESAVKGPTLDLLIPEMKYTTDNATMIALAAYHHLKSGSNTLPPRREVFEGIRAEGNLRVC